MPMMDSELTHCSHHLISIIIVFVKKPFPLGPVEAVSEVRILTPISVLSRYHLRQATHTLIAERGSLSALQYTSKRSRILPPSACRTKYVVHDQQTTPLNTETFNGDSQQKHRTVR